MKNILFHRQTPVSLNLQIELFLWILVGDYFFKDL